MTLPREKRGLIAGLGVCGCRVRVRKYTYTEMGYYGGGGLESGVLVCGVVCLALGRVFGLVLKPWSLWIWERGLVRSDVGEEEVKRTELELYICLGPRIILS